MTHTVDIPPPASGGRPEPADGSKYVMFSENHPAIATGTTAVRPPPYRRTIPSYFSRRYSVKERNCCRCCMCCCGCFLLLLIFIFTGLLLYVRFSFHPQAPSYKIKQMAVKDFTMHPAGGGATILSVAFALWLQADNPNTKIGIYYRNGGTVAIRHEGARVVSGNLPEFRQTPRDTTDMVVVMEGRSKLNQEQEVALLGNQRKGRVPLQAVLRAPLGFTVGKLELLKVAVDVDCNLVVNKLSPGVTTTVEGTDYNVRLEF